MSATTDVAARAVGRRARVHWHVTRKTFSVKVSGQPVFYAPAVSLRDCRFLVDARLRAMFVQRPARRTVHALISGVIVGFEAAPIGGEIVKCDPFLYAGFRRADTHETVWSARDVVLHPDRRIEATGLANERERGERAST